MFYSPADGLGDAGRHLCDKSRRATIRNRLWSFYACGKKEGLELRRVGYSPTFCPLGPFWADFRSTKNRDTGNILKHIFLGVRFGCVCGSVCVCVAVWVCACACVVVGVCVVCGCGCRNNNNYYYNFHFKKYNFQLFLLIFQKCKKFSKVSKVQ